MSQPPIGKLDDKALLDSCTKLAEMAGLRLDQRRALEWRISFGFWATLVTAIAYFRVQELPVFPGIAAFGIYWFSMNGVFVRNKTDTAKYWHFQKQAEKILAGYDIPASPDNPQYMMGAKLKSGWGKVLARSGLGVLTTWSAIQFLITLMLLILAYQVCTEKVTGLRLTRLSTQAQSQTEASRAQDSSLPTNGVTSPTPSAVSSPPKAQSRPEPAAPAIPAAFRGEWNEVLADCGTDNNDTRLRISDRSTRFYESEGMVRRVTMNSPRSVTVDLAMSGEGQSWQERRTLALSASGQDLTIEGFTRHRCRR